MFTALAFTSIMPEILILLLAMTILAIEPFWRQERRRNLGWITAGGLAVILGCMVAFGRPEGAASTFGGTIRFDWLGFFFKLVFIIGAAFTALLLMDHDRVGKRGEAYVMLLASTIGMCLMASASDLVLLYLAIETTSIPLYVLAGFMLSDDRSTEAGFKYLLYGAMTSAIMLYGFSLLYGFSGTTNLYELSTGMASSGVSPVALLGILLLLIVGLGFKVSLVPLHFWAPDVYEGAPTPVSGFLSTASKAAGFAVLSAACSLVVFPTGTIPAAVDWTMILAVLAAVTMTVGNLLALPQRNLKRLLAYSSIGHAGYALVGIAAATRLGIASVAFYMLAYLVTNLAAFAENGEVALRMLRDNDYDVVLMDMQMPVMDGVEATRIIRSNPRFETLPIIAMTANAMASDRMLCLEAGMNDHIAKPIDPDQLFGVLLRWLRRGGGDGKGLTTVPTARTADSQASTIELAVPGIDVRAGLKRTGGNLRRYEILLRKFAEQQSGTIAAIRGALSAGDAATAERAAHSLKGAAGTLGAHALSDAAAKAETAVKSVHGIDDAVRLLSLALDAVLANLRTALPTDGSGNGATPVAGDPASVKDPLIRLKQLLETDDGEAADFIIDAKPRLAGVLTSTEIRTLSDRVGNFDFDAALKCLSRIASRLSLNLEGK